MESEIQVEAAQHQHELLLLIPPLPVPMLAEPLLGFGQELSAAFVAWDRTKANLPPRSVPQTCLNPSLSFAIAPTCRKTLMLEGA